MITKWLIRGDCHGNFNWVNNIDTSENIIGNTGIIILGDAGLNFYLNKTDRNKKRMLQNSGFYFYLVRGNHEQRPQLLDNIECRYDPEVKNGVYYEPDYPNIHYLMDGEIYDFGGHSALVIGGAYSVDKYYRLARAGCSEDMDPNYIATHAGWFKNEQLTKDEMTAISEYVNEVTDLGQTFDFVFTHTCPYSWMPTDLFLRGLDQSTVDNSMEHWLDGIKDTVHWDTWCFGHFHADRAERPCVEQFYNDINDLEEVWNRWHSGKELDWWIPKSPQFDELI